MEAGRVVGDRGRTMLEGIDDWQQAPPWTVEATERGPARVVPIPPVRLVGNDAIRMMEDRMVSPC